MNAGLTLCFTLLSAFLLFCMSFIVTVTGNGNGTVTIPNVNISASSASAVGIRNPFLPALVCLLFLGQQTKDLHDIRPDAQL